MSPELLEVFLGYLAVDTRRRTPPAVDACLARHPKARRVLDVGGGHGELALAFAQQSRKDRYRRLASQHAIGDSCESPMATNSIE
jgi:ubiquinone/menaquinone biosynthesis C-methylase UbiE